MAAADYEYCRFCDRKALYVGDADVSEGAEAVHTACLDQALVTALPAGTEDAPPNESPRDARAVTEPADDLMAALKSSFAGRESRKRATPSGDAPEHLRTAGKDTP